MQLGFFSVACHFFPIRTCSPHTLGLNTLFFPFASPCGLCGGFPVFLEPSNVIRCLCSLSSRLVETSPSFTRRLCAQRLFLSPLPSPHPCRHPPCFCERLSLSICPDNCSSPPPAPPPTRPHHPPIHLIPATLNHLVSLPQDLPWQSFVLFPQEEGSTACRDFPQFARAFLRTVFNLSRSPFLSFELPPDEPIFVLSVI